ncbi:MAG: T9SS type A sorting domain-containing protein [Sphingobacteriales bacterium]|nr:MAG: T9SS type A sorting domain-containing protein [Sphingobacteriales bacterium]
MKKSLLFLCFFSLIFSGARAQVFQVDTIRYNGDISKYINIVLMGDGFTAAQQSDFIAAATNTTDYLLSQEPMARYAGYFNVFAIKVNSIESGVTHPQNLTECAPPATMPVFNVNTHLGCTFDSYGIHRLVVPMNFTNSVDVLASNFPSYDQVIVLSNTAYYGGSGGGFSTSTLHPESNEIVAHEFGHSFGGLADEYYAGDQYSAEKPNMTQQTNPALVKWKNWLGHNGTGIFQYCCSGNSADWYKPHDNCKMELLGAPFCSVCQQTIVESIHALTDPIVSYSPQVSTIQSSDQFLAFSLDKLMKPAPNTLNITWQLGQNIVAHNTDSVLIEQNLLPAGLHNLTVTVVDTTALVRVDGHSDAHLSSVTWTINKTTTGTGITSAANRFAVSVFPNPTAGSLSFTLELEKESTVSAELMSADGKVIMPLKKRARASGTVAQTTRIDHLPSGSYVVVFKVDGLPYSRSFIKQ